MDPHTDHPLSATTTAIHAGRGGSEPGQPLNVAPALVSNFRLGEPGQDGRSYSRGDSNAAIEAFEEVIGLLEGGAAVAYASGMAAISAALDQLPAGGALAVPQTCYQGTVALAEHLVRTRAGSLVRLAQDDTAGWIAAVASSDVVLLESPNNPLLRVADLRAICGAPTDGRAVIVVDSTMATPLNQRPLDVGADIVVHSATKAIGGHADLLLGIAVASDAGLLSALRQHRTLNGASPGAMETFLATRGVRTLPLRLRQSQANAQTLAERLERHELVTLVHHPGLVSHVDHELAAATLAGFGSTMSFELRGDAATADGVCANLGLIVHATSLGGIETSIERRAAVPGQEHLPPTLLRLSVGCEDVEDLWADLLQAFSGVTRTG